MGKIGLVLEGGGMRGAYTAGVLDWLIEHDMMFDYVVGISSGALYAGMYVVKQREALYKASVQVAADKRNVGLQAIKNEKTIVGYEFLYKTITEDLDYPISELGNQGIECDIGVYDIDAEETVWIDQHQVAKEPRFIQAACTLPIVGSKVTINGRDYMDGGITTMIPVDKSIAKGCEKHFVITTKSADFVRKPQGFFQKHLLRFVYRKHPKLIADFEDRTEVYYQERDTIKQLVDEKKAMTLHPSKEVGVSRFGGSQEQFQELFDMAHADCDAIHDELLEFFQSVKGNSWGV